MIKFYDFILTLTKPFVIFTGYFGLPKRKVTGEHYYKYRDSIEVGTVILTRTNWEFSNLINPTKLKHCGIYVGKVFQDDICYVLEATSKGVVLTDLVTFLTSKDIAVGCKPKFVRNNEFYSLITAYSNRYRGVSYDYLFNKDGKAFYCFELAATCLKDVYSEIQLKCKEIVKGKKIYSEDTFLDKDFFQIVFDSRKD